MITLAKIKEHDDECERIKKHIVPGPWSKEPNRVEFEHAGLTCLLARGPMLSWCGYVGVPPGHPAHGRQNEDLEQLYPDFSVHGGVTYTNECSEHICHVPKPGEPDELWWFGWDFAHSYDFIPGMLSNIELAPILAKDGHYWTVEEVRRETERAAEQLARIGHG